MQGDDDRDRFLLADATRRFGQAFDHGAIPMAIVTPARRCLRVNEALADALGRPADEVLGADFATFTHPDDDADTRAGLVPLLAGTAQAVRFSKRYLRADGSIVHAEVAIEGIWSGGELLYAFVQFVDVSSTVRAHEDLRRTIATANDAFITIDDQGVVREWNGAAESMFGWSRDQVLGSELAERIMADPERTAHRNGLAGLHAGGGEESKVIGRTIETVAVRRSGERFPVELTVWRTDTAAGASAYHAFVRDIAERHRAQAALAEAEARWRLTLDNAPIGISLVRLDGRFLRVNAALCAILGYSADELLTMAFQDITHPDDLDADLVQLAALVVGDIDSYTLEKRYLHADGHEVWVSLSRALINDEHGEPLHFVTQIEDITARVRTEQAQRLSEARFRTLFTHAAVGVIEARPDGTIAAANPTICELLGYSAAELIGQPAAFISEPADQEAQARQIAGIADGSDGYSTQRTYRRKDGTTLPVLVSVGVVRNAERGIERLVGTIVDMTAQVAAEAALRAAHTKLAQRQAFTEAVIESVDAGVLACDVNGEVVLRNAAQRDLMGLSPDANPTREEVKEQVRVLRGDGSEVSLIDPPLLQALRGIEQAHAAMRIEAGNGSTAADVLVTTRQIRDHAGTVLGAVAAFTDVTAERQTQERLREGAAFHDAVLAATPDLIFVSDPRSHNNIWASRSILGMLGYTEDQVRELGSALLQTLVHPDDVERVISTNVAAQDLVDGDVLQLRYRVRHASGESRWLSRRVTPFTRDETGAVTQVLGVARDVTDIIDFEERLSQAALHDPLTALPNRTLLADRLRNALYRCIRSGHEIAVLFCDLDGFKRVNDTAGHAAGDTVLLVTAERLVNTLRAEDTVARVGGDEFAIILEPSYRKTDPGTVVDVRSYVAATADRIRHAVNEPIEIGDTSHVVSASIGITFATAGADPAELLREADTAMYKAKAGGRDRTEIFDGSLRTDAAERGRVEHVLRSTIDAINDHGHGHDEPRPGKSFDGPRTGHGRLSVDYQPIFDLDTMRLVGFEALARMRDQHDHPIAPDAFIPVAEETGLISPLGRHILDTACNDLARWHNDHPTHRHMGVAVNLSARQAGLADLRDQVHTALSRTRLAPQLLTLELTESVLLEAGRSTMTAISAIQEMGVRISIDDFGTGYASLRYLAQLPVSSVKVDRSFTAGIPTDPTSSSIVRAIAGLARDLQLGCIVEGIETTQQLEALPPGVHGQGYLLGRPMPTTDIETLLNSTQA